MRREGNMYVGHRLVQSADLFRLRNFVGWDGMGWVGWESTMKAGDFVREKAQGWRYI